MIEERLKNLDSERNYNLALFIFGEIDILVIEGQGVFFQIFIRLHF